MMDDTFDSIAKEYGDFVLPETEFFGPRPVNNGPTAGEAVAAFAASRSRDAKVLARVYLAIGAVAGFPVGFGVGSLVWTLLT